jgi:hypothetical protein
MRSKIEVLQALEAALRIETDLDRVMQLKLAIEKLEMELLTFQTY